MESYDFIFSYSILGDHWAGKTSLLFQFLHKRFRQKQDITEAVVFNAKPIKVDDLQIKFHFWDTAGLEIYHGTLHFRKQAAILVVYDISKRVTFNSVIGWLEVIKEDYENSKTTIILVGNKTDLKSKREVTTEEGMQLANQQNVLFIETSAKVGDHVEDAFIVCAKEIIQKIKSKQIDLCDENCGIYKGKKVQNKNTLQIQGENKKLLSRCY